MAARTYHSMSLLFGFGMFAATPALASPSAVDLSARARTASLEAALVAVAAWTPAACAFDPAVGATPRWMSPAPEDQVEVVGASSLTIADRSAAAADAGW